MRCVMSLIQALVLALLGCLAVLCLNGFACAHFTNFIFTEEFRKQHLASLLPPYPTPIPPRPPPNKKKKIPGNHSASDHRFGCLECGSEILFLIANIVMGTETVHSKMNCEQITSCKLSVRHCIIIMLSVTLLRRVWGQKGLFWTAGLNCCRVVPEATGLHSIAASPYFLTRIEPFLKSSSTNVKALSGGECPRSSWCVRGAIALAVPTPTWARAVAVCWSCVRGLGERACVGFKARIQAICAAHTSCSQWIRSTTCAWRVFQPQIWHF